MHASRRILNSVTLDHGMGESEGDCGEVVGHCGILSSVVVRVAFRSNVVQPVRRHSLPV